MGSLALAIEPAAREWIGKRGGGAMTLRASPRHGCCGGMARLPVAAPGVPDDVAEWETRTVDGVSVRLDPMLGGKDRALTIRVEGFLGWRRLFVEETDPARAPSDADQST